jgi:superoxide dismutase, Fe-Mn family
MANLSGASYTAKEFNLSDLKGISNETLEIHFGLYKGYVTNTNTLNEKLAEMIKGGQAGTPAYAELTRRLGFEYNGMVLHEYYFGNMKKDGCRSQLW